MESFEYKVTIIIPVYNVENYLRDCLNSLVSQTISQSDMEVLMINDGSPDHSLEICQEYVDKYDNFKVISQENQGVSAARNMGIRNARGKYLLYLDGDDMLSPETVKNVTNFFDQHYDEVDIVTYPLVYRQNGGDRSHWRYEVLRDTGIYELEKYPYISQTTMNICVKNYRKGNAIFDTAFPIAEDQTYVTDLLLSKSKLGFCKKATYYYLQHENNTSKFKNHPYYSYDKMMCFFDNLVQKMNSSYEMEKYLGGLILYNLNWRITGDVLFPYHYNATQFNQAYKKLISIIDTINSETILNYPKMNDSHKYFLLSLKSKNRPFVSAEKNKLIILDTSGELRSDSSIQIVVNQSKINGNTFFLLAYLKNYAFSFLEKPKLWAMLDGEKYIEIPLFISQHSCYWTKFRTNTYWGFQCDFKLNEVDRIEFLVEIRNILYPVNYWFTNKQVIQPTLNRNYIRGETYSIIFENNQFYKVKTKNYTFKKMESSFERMLWKTHKKQWLVRKYSKKKNRKAIWLYRDSYNTLDNAYYQFQHDFAINDGVERYYVYNADSIEWEKNFQKEQRKCLVEFGSKKHKRLFIQADKILVSFIDRIAYVPFDEKTIQYYWDLFHFEVIYLQHGVMHAKIPNMYSKEKMYMIDKVVASTPFEKNNLENELNFRSQDIVCTGMSRLDQLQIGKPKRKILFALSWRNYLVTQNEQAKWVGIKGFEQTDYFCEVKSFLSDTSLKQLLYEKDYVLEIKLHPIFSAYEDNFKQFVNEKMRIVKETELNEYSVCITDFSSFMYDCFYLDIPVISHIFDRERFKAGLHSYRELFWSLERDYPFYCQEPKDIIALLGKMLMNQELFETKFKNYVEDFYFSRESNHAEQLYFYLKEGR